MVIRLLCLLALLATPAWGQEDPADPNSCGDSADNDGDGLFDCCDPDCDAIGTCAVADSCTTLGDDDDSAGDDDDSAGDDDDSAGDDDDSAAVTVCDFDGDGDFGEALFAECDPCRCDLDDDGIDDCAAGPGDLNDSDEDGVCNNIDVEECDGQDNDGDGEFDEGFDLDGDGLVSCDADGDGEDDDCDDSDPTINTLATEACNGVDDNCDGVLFTGEDDIDGDGFFLCGLAADVDCDDEDATINPGATELCDFADVDHDCDGVSDLNEVFTPAELVGLTDTDLDGTPDCQDVDADGDGVARPTDCDDQAPDVFPTNGEVCETGDQVDSDCNGDVDSAADGSSLTGNVISRFVDLDLDGFGTGLGVEFCEEPDALNCQVDEATGDPLGTGICYAFVAGDCDDVNATRNPDAEEACNGIDEDCDEVVDEPESLSATGSGCRDMYRDLDSDGVGDWNVGNCLCLIGDVTETTYLDDRYVLVGGDCDDESSATHPSYTTSNGIVVPAATEVHDGSDNDCDGLLAAVELDCDDDGSLPLLPRPGAATLTADEVGLVACTLDDTRQVNCWDDEPLDLVCDLAEVDSTDDNGDPITVIEGSGLWVLRYGESDDAFGGRYDGGARIYATTPPCSQIGDCDDLCSSRCADGVEVCDGIDNDCTGALDLGTASGLPESMTAVTSLEGIIHVAEGDLDQDGYLDCDNFDVNPGFEFTWSAATCGAEVTEPTLLTDCNPSCTLSNPGATEVCNGFTDLCSGPVEGSDEDRDGHRTCGAWSDPAAGDDEPAEQLFAVVWEAGAGLDADLPAAIPLMAPRVGTCTDGQTPRGSGTSCVVTCDEVLYDALAWLLAPTATDVGTPLDADELTAAEQMFSSLQEGFVRAEDLVHAICMEPSAVLQQAEARAPRAQMGSCALVELSLTSRVDSDVETELRAIAPTLVTTTPFGGDVSPFDRGVACLDHPEEYVSRTVWTQARILESRHASAEWECMRLYEGVTGCLDIEEITELSDGFESMPDATLSVSSSTVWHAELGNFTPAGFTAGTIQKCWGDLSLAEHAQEERTGGDCSDGTTNANRDLSEGPWDLRAQYDLTAFGDELSPLTCDLCLDGIDNNCDGSIDCEDPSCAPCFVGIGGGCYAAGSPCAPGCGANLTSPKQDAQPLAVLFALLITGTLTRRRKA